MKRYLLAAAVLAASSGCSTTKDWTATGGSRADGVVRLSYEVGGFEVPKLDESQAVSIATRRCSTWGFTGAEAFGGTTQQCSQPGGFGGCARWTVTKEYQCTGEGNAQSQGGGRVDTISVPPPPAKTDGQQMQWRPKGSF